jgi:hypothetical protein
VFTNASTACAQSSTDLPISCSRPRWMPESGTAPGRGEAPARAAQKWADSAHGEWNLGVRPDTAHGIPLLPLSLETVEVRGGYCSSDRPVKDLSALPAIRTGRPAVSS